MLLFYILISVALESLISLLGAFFAYLGYSLFKKYLHYFISFSAGTFLAVVFFNILPEAIEISNPDIVLSYTLIGFLLFFLLSRFLHWYHHHEEDCIECENTSESGNLVLVGDFIHNFIDGIIITMAFLIDINMGIVTTVAVLFHELPQEISDFFILVNSGYSNSKALFFNFLVSFSTLVGALITFFLAKNIDQIIGPALGIVAGNFLYISMSDLIPELNIKHKNKGTLKQILFMGLGIFIIYIITTFIPE